MDIINDVVYEFLPEKHEQTVYLLGTLLLQLGNFKTRAHDDGQALHDDPAEAPSPDHGPNLKGRRVRTITSRRFSLSMARASSSRLL